MAIWQIFKVSRKTFFNPSGWLDTETLSTSTATIWDVIKATTTPDTPLREESYQGALKRLKISDKEAQERGKTFTVYAYIFASLGALCILFSFYLLFYHTFFGWIIGLCAAALFFGQGFRFHFWAFQIKHRKLGCSFEEWRNGKVKRTST